ncbi:mas-related G-protein coupled receptor member D [Heterocephalus glaber]|uniref:Mas-related G-protein coupled receptor member D n=1 Tax=Heterocephalus glaber TaxID=10181 RepID=A0AAX6PI72_HETGA|nr:mas-related G-protein coupled receptor member D [Heterocephalus glaber]
MEFLVGPFSFPGMTLTPSTSSSRMDEVTWVYFSMSFLTTVISVCGIAGNSVVVWLLSRRLRSTPFSVYILNLAVADLLFLLCMASIIILETQPLPDFKNANLSAILSTNPRAKASAMAYEVVTRVKYFAYTTSLSLLTAISTQRCLSALYPFWYKCHRPRHLSSIVSALLWVLSFTMNMLASFFCNLFWHFIHVQCFKIDMALGTLILGVFTPVMAISSAILFVQVRKSTLVWRRRQPRRLYVIILASVFVFLVCSLPLGIYWFVLYWVGLQPQVKFLWVCLSRLSSSVSSSANPVIYFLVGSQRSWRLKESMGAILDRALQEEPELEGRETLSTGTQEGI